MPSCSIHWITRFSRQFARTQSSSRRLGEVTVESHEFDSFFDRFHTETRAILQWGALRSIHPILEVRETLLAEPEEVGRLGLPWADHVNGRQYARDFVGDTPLWTADRAANVDQALARAVERADPSLAGYQAPGRPTILFDGAHRALAAVRGLVELPINLAVIYGPDDPLLFVDLGWPDTPSSVV